MSAAVTFPGHGLRRFYETLKRKLARSVRAVVLVLQNSVLDFPCSRTKSVRRDEVARLVPDKKEEYPARDAPSGFKGNYDNRNYRRDVGQH